MDKIYANITTEKGIDVLIETEDYDSLYEAIMEITDNDHEISSDAACWCELASIGEEYDFKEGRVEIVEL